MPMGRNIIPGLGARIRHARSERGWSAGQLATRSGCTYQTVWNAETENSTPTAHSLRLLAIALHVSTDWLLGMPADLPNGIVDCDPELRLLLERVAKRVEEIQA